MAQLITAGIAALIASDLVIEINPRLGFAASVALAPSSLQRVLSQTISSGRTVPSAKAGSRRVRIWMQRCRPRRHQRPAKRLGRW